MNHLPLDKSIILDKALKKAGVEMVTQCVYRYKTHTLRIYDTLSKSFREITREGFLDSDIYSNDRYDSRTFVCPTLSEMIELLPETIKIRKDEYDLEIKRPRGNWEVEWVYYYYEPMDMIGTHEAPTLLEAVYEALLWCLREGYILGKE